MISIQTFPDQIAAELARAHLDAHGVRAFVIESASFNPLLSDAAGGVRLTVAPADRKRAIALLRELESRTVHERDEDDEPGEVVRCPRCELEYCFFEHAGADLLRLGAKRWRCRKCRHVWDDPSEGPNRKTALPADEPAPVFLLRRRAGGLGSFVGVIAGFFLGIVTQTDLLVLSGLGGAAGAFFGRTRQHDVCSEPACRVSVEEGLSRCPKCDGAIAGRIAEGYEHWIRAAEYRRDLASQLARVTYRERPPKRETQ